MKKIIVDYTVGDVPRGILRYAWPFMVDNGLQVFYSLVDMLVVGRCLGSYGLSAVTVASQLLLVFTMACLGFSQAGQILIAHMIGGKQHREIGKIAGTLGIVVIILGIVTSIILLFLNDPLLKLVNTPAESFSMARKYLLICGAGIWITFGYNAVAAILRGIGDSLHPMLFILLATAINITLDLLFVAALKLGVLGAAIATIIAQAVALSASLHFLYRHRHEIGVNAAVFCLDPLTFRQILRMGIPFALQSGVINLSMMFVNALVNDISVYASAAYGIGMKLDDIVIKVTQGLLYSVSFFAGQNIAAGKLKRVRKSVYWGWIYSFLGYAVITMLYLTSSESLFSFFTDDPQTIALSKTFVRGIVWCFPALILMRGVLGLIQGIGNAKLSFVLGIGDGVSRILFSYLLGHMLGMGLYGFVLGYSIAAYAIALPGLMYYLSGRWERYRLITPSCVSAEPTTLNSREGH